MLLSAQMRVWADSRLVRVLYVIRVIFGWDGWSANTAAREFMARAVRGGE